MQNSRTKNSIRNSTVSVICKIITLVFSFVVRTIFINKLGKEILGIEGLFSSIITILNLADLGVGTAIIFLLYKPIAENDSKKTAAIMQYFKKFYTIVGFIVLIVGIALTPLVPYLVKLDKVIDNLYLYYILTIILTASSYFFASNRCLFEANQNSYIVTIIDSIMTMIGSSVKLLILLLTKNYVFYLIIGIITTLLTNFIIYFVGNKIYNKQLTTQHEPLSKTDKKLIGSNIKAVMAHKVGSVLVTGTDNLLISLFVSTLIVGVYSNYLLIINTISTLVTIAITALTPSVGNLKATSENSEKDFNIFKKINFISFWLICVTTICLFSLFNPFINIWIGPEFLFDWKIVLILCVNYFISTMRYGIGVFATAAGYFKQTWYKPYAEGIINLIVSIVLSKFIGVAGIFLGTTVSLLLGSFWIDPVITYKMWFKKNVLEYFVVYLLRALLTIAIGFATYKLINLIHISNLWIEWFIKAIICLIFTNICLIACLFWTKEFKEIGKKFLKKK